MKIDHLYLNDKSIVLAIKNADKNAVAYLYKTYYQMVKHFVIQNSGTLAEAEDLYQEGILDVYENIVNDKFSLQSNTTLKTYIYSVCRNKWMYELRKKCKSPVNFNESNEFIELNLYEEETEEMPYTNVLSKALEQIGNKCKEIIKDFYYHKMTMEQIAHKNNFISANVAKSSKERCMKKAREIANKILEQYNKV